MTARARSVASPRPLGVASLVLLALALVAPEGLGVGLAAISVVGFGLALLGGRRGHAGDIGQYWGGGRPVTSAFHAGAADGVEPGVRRERPTGLAHTAGRYGRRAMHASRGPGRGSGCRRD